MARRLVFGMLMMMVCTAGLSGRLPAQPAAADAAFVTFWAASSPEEAARLVDPIVHAGVSFEEAYRRLRQGRSYAARDAS